MDNYLVGQVCLNGHPITDNAASDLSQDYCSICGAKTITSCQYCGKPIHGKYQSGILMIGFSYIPDAYCYGCGKPYPWTEAAINNAALLIQEESELGESEKTALTASLPDILSETPGTNLAVVRMKKALAAAGKFTADALRQFVIDFGCELAKKSLLP